MAWITGRVQMYESPKPRTITVGEPFARKAGDKYYCIETGKELKATKVNVKQLMSRVKSRDQETKE